MNAQTELETLIPQPLTLEIGGERLDILPLNIGQLVGGLKALKPALADIQGDINLTLLAADHGETLLSAISAVTGKSVAWLEGLPAHEFIRLAGSILEVNADFFTRYLLPEITAAASRIEKATGAGLTLSTS